MSFHTNKGNQIIYGGSNFLMWEILTLMREGMKTMKGAHIRKGGQGGPCWEL